MASTNIDDWIIDNSEYIGKRALEIGSKKHKDDIIYLFSLSFKLLNKYAKQITDNDIEQAI